jgi:hypothetical protein
MTQGRGVFAYTGWMVESDKAGCDQQPVGDVAGCPACAANETLTIHSPTSNLT